jgi:hypothetical protein
MQNAHLRMGKLKFMRQTRDTITVRFRETCVTPDRPPLLSSVRR